MAPLHNPAGLSPVIAGAWRLGEWQWTAPQCLAWIEANLDIGVSSFDQADPQAGQAVQALFGAALALRPGLRSRLQLVSSCRLQALKPGDSLAAQVQAAVAQSLQALRTDHLDLLLVQGHGVLLDADALAAVFTALRQTGQVRSFGLSHASPGQLAALHQRFPLATHQIALSPLQCSALHDGVLDQCLALGLQPMAWAPLAGGRIFSGQDASACRLRALLQSLAAERGIAVTTLVIAWVRQHASRPLPILGSRRIGVAQDAVAALGLQLDDAAWQRIATAASDNGDDRPAAA